MRSMRRSCSSRSSSRRSLAPWTCTQRVRIARSHKVTQVLRDYFELAKPRIIVLLLITTAAAMIMAARGIPPLGVAFWTLLGGALAAGSAGALNCVYDSDIDGLMKRTMLRPIPQGRVSVRNATVYAVVLGIAAFAILF